MNELEEDFLFVGATRPAMIWGVPFGYFLVTLLTGVCGFLLTNTIEAALICVPVFIVGFLISLKEPRRLTQFYIDQTEIGRLHKNVKFWGCRSYSPFGIVHKDKK